MSAKRMMGIPSSGSNAAQNRDVAPTRPKEKMGHSKYYAPAIPVSKTDRRREKCSRIRILYVQCFHILTEGVIEGRYLWIPVIIVKGTGS